MKPIRLSRQRPRLQTPPPHARPQVELLEHRNLLSSGTFALTTISQVSGASPLAQPPSSPTVDYNSEVEPQVAVDPANTSYAVAIWQQDRYFSVGGARALVASVTINAAAQGGATWSKPTPIPWFNATDSLGSAFQRYTDPWVSIAPNGVVYASALALTPAGPVPGDTAVLVITGSITVTGNVASITWNSAGPATLIHTTAPGSLPIDQANDKEMIVADPHDSSGRTAYAVWDQLDFPSDTADFNALHAGAAIRENAFFSKTTDGGAHWTPAQNITNFQNLLSAFGNQLVVEPDGSLVDSCTLFKGSGKQAPQAGKITLAVLRSTDGGSTWSAPIIGPGVEGIGITDPNTGAPVRDGESIVSVTGDPSSGNLYAVWADGRFSNFASEGIAFSTSTDGGLTWSDPIQVNQTPTNIPAGDQQAFTPTVAVNSAGTVAVTYYDFRNNTSGPVLATDYWLAHASSNFTDPSSWASDEKRLTDTSFDMEKAPPTNHGVFLGDYQGLAAAGTSFYALFAQAGSGASDPSNIWFRDPPPAPVAPSSVTPAPGDLAADALGGLGVGAFAGNAPSPGVSALPAASGRPSVVDPVPSLTNGAGPVVRPAAQATDVPQLGGTNSAGDGDAVPDATISDGWDNPLPG